ncbi:copper chaperone [Saccharomycopsis crataegensis]|uniref:Superoxide dismutase 1 copper chaperone n=1 Tax=Saccharomycopsis crataegensis TaxID=43959 RepID=A0AAV5QKG6_9ASCO|nr:copper chaperone [Saccharomycopsis crataegensis]
MADTFEAVYAVPMECNACVDAVSKALAGVDGVTRYDIDLRKQLVNVSGSAAPSKVVGAIQETGKDAIIRGTGKPESAAVAILESFDPRDNLAPVKGLARMVSVGEQSLLIDLTLNGMEKGVYYPSIRSSGNISNGAHSTGKTLRKLDPIIVNEKSDNLNSLFFGQSFVKVPLKISELIGRSVAISRKEDELSEDSLVGVVARSAGIWQNDKQVCSCTGKTIWQERSDAIHHGIKI